MNQDMSGHSICEHAVDCFVECVLLLAYSTLGSSAIKGPPGSTRRKNTHFNTIVESHPCDVLALQP